MKAIALFCFFLLPNLAFSQAQKKAKRDTCYIIDYADALTLRSFASYERNRFEMKNAKTDEKFVFEPDNAVRMGFGASFKRFGFNLNFKLPNIQNTQFQKSAGNTKEFTMQAFLFFRKFGGDFAMRNYRGLFWVNQKDFNLPEPSFHFPFSPNMSIGELSGTFFYITNHRKFSFRSSFIQDERQIKTAATFLLGFTANAMTFKNDKNNVGGIAGQFFPVEHYGSNQIGVLMGGAANFCVKQHWVFSGTLLQSFMNKNMRISFFDHSREDIFLQSPSLFIRLNLDATYSAKKYFCGFSFTSNDYLMRSDNAVRRFQAQVRFFGGLRFFRKNSQQTSSHAA